MPHLLTSRLPALALVVALAAATGGCADDSSAAVSPEIAKLRAEVKDAQRRGEQVQERLDRFERRLDGISQDIDRLAHAAVDADRVATAAAATEDHGEGSAAPDDPDAPIAASELVDLLQSEQGQELVAGAIRALEERRDQERRGRMVAMMVERFAEAAALTPTQTADVTRIVGESFRKMSEVWAGMRNAGDLTAEERTALREENVRKMEEIRDATSDEMKAVLNAEQFAIYTEQANRMRGFGGAGGGGRRGGFDR